MITTVVVVVIVVGGDVGEEVGAGVLLVNDGEGKNDDSIFTNDISFSKYLKISTASVSRNEKVNGFGIY